jgi:hypothetical protein
MVFFPGRLKAKNLFLGILALFAIFTAIAFTPTSAQAATLTPLTVVLGGYPGSQYQPDAHFSTGIVSGVSTPASSPQITSPSSTPFTFVAACIDSTACATGSTIYWNFGDGQTSTTTSPTIEHAYTAPGTYRVTATVTTQSGVGTSHITALVSARYADVSPDTVSQVAPPSRSSILALAASTSLTPCRVALNISGINPGLDTTSTAEGRDNICPTPSSSYGPSNALQNLTPSQIFEKAVLGYSPSVFYPLQETSGSTALDISGNGNNGLYSGSGITLGTPGPFSASYAPTFSASSPSSVTSTYYATSTSSITELLWLKTTTTAPNVRLLTDTLSNASSVSLTLNDPNATTPGGITASIVGNSSSTTDIGVTSTQNVADGNWHFIEVVWNPNRATSAISSQFSLYIDGSLAPTTPVNIGTQSLPLTGTSPGYTLAQPPSGSCSPSCSAFSGALAYAAIFNNQALTYQEISNLALAATNYQVQPQTPQQLFQNAILAQSPNVLWPLNDAASSNTVLDASKNGYNGTLSGAPIRSPGPINGATAPNFTGTNNVVTSSYQQNNVTSYSISALINTTSSATQQVLVTDNTGYPAYSLTLMMGGYAPYSTNVPGALDLLVTGGSSSTSPTVIGIQTKGAYNDGGWHYVVGTWSAPSGTAVAPTQFTLYVDGKKAASAPITAPIGTATSPLSGTALSGANGTELAGTLNGYSGQLADVAIYPTVLSAATISATYNVLFTDPSSLELYNHLTTSTLNFWPLAGPQGNITYSDIAQTSPGAYGNYASNWLIPEGSGTPDYLSQGPFNNTPGAVSLAGNSFLSSTLQTTEPSNDILTGWFNTTSSGVIASFTNSQTSSQPTESDQSLWIDSKGRVNFAVTSEGTLYQLTSTQSYNNDLWHYFVVNVSPTETTLSIDDQIVARSSHAVSTSGLTGYWRFGQGITTQYTNPASSNYLTGSIADIAQYANLSYPLTLGDYYLSNVFASSNAFQNSYDTYVENQSPVAYWSLAGSTPLDNIFNPQDPLSNIGSANSISLNASGPLLGYPSSAAFTGVNGLSETTSSSSLSSFSVDIWFQTTSNQGGILAEFTNKQKPGSASQYDRAIWITDQGDLVFGTASGSPTTPTYAELATPTNVSYNDGRWHLAVVTIGSSGATISVDGALVASTTPAPALESPYNGYWAIGGGVTTGWNNVPENNAFNGNIADVSILNFQQNASQITDLYQEAQPPSLLTSSVMPPTSLNGVTGLSCLASPSVCGFPPADFAASGGGNPVAGCGATCIADLTSQGYLQTNGNLAFNPLNCTYGYGPVLTGGNWSVVPGAITPGCVTRGQFFQTLAQLLDSNPSASQATLQSSTLACPDATPAMKRVAALGISPIYDNSGYCFPTLGISKEDAYVALSQALQLNKPTSCPTTLRDLADETLGHGTPTPDPNCEALWSLFNAGLPLLGNTTCADGTGVCFNGSDFFTNADEAVLFSGLLNGNTTIASGIAPDLYASPTTVTPGTPITLTLNLSVPAYYPAETSFDVTWSPANPADSTTCAPTSLTISAQGTASTTCTYTPTSAETVPVTATISDPNGNVNSSTVILTSSTSTPVLSGGSMPTVTHGTTTTATFSVSNTTSANFGVRSALPDLSTANISNPTRVWTTVAVTTDGLASIVASNTTSVTVEITPPNAGSYSFALEACSPQQCTAEEINGTAT